MPKNRNKENKGLPARWRKTHGAYYYRVPPGMEDHWDGKKEFRLGNDLSEAYKTWADRLKTPDAAKNIAQLIDRYLLQVIPKKAARSQIADQYNSKRLRNVFGHMAINTMTPQRVYKYVDARKAKVSAKREMALLSHMFTKAVEWGYLNQHPFKGEIRLEGEKPRTRYVEDWEVEECLTLSPMRKRGSVLAIQSYIRIKLLTGLRRGDLLRLQTGNLCEDGIHIKTNKTGKPIIYDWSDALRKAVDMAKNSRPVDISPWLFCNKKGKSYMDESKGDASGWNSMWQRFFDRVLKETKVKERFTEHDLRAKVASDADSLEHARQLLAHADSKITQRVYRRKAEVVRPAK